MILEQFLDYYLSHTRPDIAAQITALLPAGSEKNAHNLAGMFKRSDEEGLEFQLGFYEMMAEIRQQNPGHCIMFDDSKNVCYPFFINYAWERLPLAAKARAQEYYGVSGVEELVPRLIEQCEARNWFRVNLAPSLKQEDLFDFNEIIALINFSSGGEYSFLDLVYPQVKALRGMALDAGCGAGFASLVMSQHLEVTGIDACRPRLGRAKGMANMLQKGKNSFLPRVVNLIETEMGEIFSENRASIKEGLLEERRPQLSFVQGSLDRLTFPDQSFDAIVCLDVLEHTYDPAAVLNQFARVAKPGADLFITVPTSNGELYQRFEEDTRGATFPAMLHLHHWEPHNLIQFFRRYSFELEKIELFDHLAPETADRLLAAGMLSTADESGFPLQIFAVFRRELKS